MHSERQITTTESLRLRHGLYAYQVVIIVHPVQYSQQWPEVSKSSHASDPLTKNPYYQLGIWHSGPEYIEAL